MQPILSKALVLIKLLDIISKLAYIPWGIKYLEHSLDESWPRIVAAYGLQCAAMTLGELIGRNWLYNYKLSTSQQFFSILRHCFMMSFAYFLIAISTRFSFFFVCHFLLGLSGSSLTLLAKSIEFNVNSRRNVAWNRSNSKTDSYLDASSTALMFSPLISGLLYSSSITSRFPSFLPCIIFSALCFALVLPYILLVLCNQRKSALSLEGIGGGGESPQEDSEIHDKSKYPLLQDEVIFNGVIPKTFLKMCRGNQEAARKAYLNNLAWRNEFQVDRLLSAPQPQPCFDNILKYYPHAIHGVSRDGCIVVYEVLGQAKLKELSAAGITPLQMTWHFVFRNEFIFRMLKDTSTSTNKSPRNSKNILEVRDREREREAADEEESEEEGGGFVQIMTVLDVQGARMTDFTTDVISFIKQSSDIVDSYYPGRVVRLVICNTPIWFHSIWSMISRILPESTKKKIRIIGSAASLDEFIAADQRPAQYGGHSCDLGQSVEHREFLRIARSGGGGGMGREEEHRSEEGGASASAYFPSGTSLRPPLAIPGPAPTTATGTGTSMKRSYSTELQWISSQAPAQPTATAKGSLPTITTTASTDSNLTSANPIAATTNNSNSSSTWTSWISGLRLKVGGTPRAFLGDKNSYHYDAALGAWTLASKENGEDDDSEDMDSNQSHRGSDPRDSSRKRGMSRLELEEHGLVLAIQAAHLAALDRRSSREEEHRGGGGGSDRDRDWEALGRNMSRTTSNGNGFHAILSDSSRLTSSTLPRPSQSIRSTGAGGAIRERGDHHYQYDMEEEEEDRDSLGSAHTGEKKWSRGDMIVTVGGKRGASSASIAGGKGGKIFADVLLLVIWAHLVSCSMQAILLCLLPAWFAGPVSKGGLGYSPVDIGLALSGAGMVLRICSPLGLKKRFDYLLTTSPARSLRIGCGALSVCCLALPFFLSHPSGVTVTLNSLEHTLQQTLPLQATGVTGTGTGLAMSYLPAAPPPYSSLLSAFTDRPSRTPRAIFLPALFIVVLITASHLGRKSSAILLHVALSPSIASPDMLRIALEGMADTLAPVLSAVLSGAVLRMNLRFPLDASLPLALVALLGIMLYLSSLLIQVKFRGDFGVVSDQVIKQSRGGSGKGGVGGLREVFRVPVGDVLQLFAPMGTGFETGLLHIRSELKDV